MPTTWTEEKENLLLLSMLQIFAPSKIGTANWERVANKMGPEYTARSIAIRYGKMVRTLQKPDTGLDASTTATSKAEKVVGSSDSAKRKRSRLVEDAENESEDGSHGFKEPQDTQVKFAAKSVTPPRNPKTSEEIYEELKAAMDAVGDGYF